MFFAKRPVRLANIARAVSIENQDPNRQSWKLPIFTDGRPIEQDKKKAAR
jgi:hypothetical protein